MEKASEPGRGRKKCGGCGFYIGVRNAKCDCGYVFGVAAVEASKQQIDLSRPSPPTKTEPKTEPTVPLNPLELEKAEKTNYSHANRVIFVPAGHCPIKPVGYKSGWDEKCSDEEVVNWAFAVKNYVPAGISEHDYIQLVQEAVVYFARQFWDLNGPEFPRVRRLISEVFS